MIPSQKDFLSFSPNFLFDGEVEEAALQYARESGSWLPIPDQPLHFTKILNTAKPSSHPVYPTMVTQQQNNPRSESVDHSVKEIN